MAKDDMEVIMYKILKYLYECMKKDISPQLEDFSWDSKLFHIPQNYWCKIIVTLVRKGYITGFKIIDNTKDVPTIQTDRPVSYTHLDKNEKFSEKSMEYNFICCGCMDYNNCDC